MRNRKGYMMLAAELAVDIHWHRNGRWNRAYLRPGQNTNIFSFLKEELSASAYRSLLTRLGQRGIHIPPHESSGTSFTGTEDLYLGDLLELLAEVV